MLLREDGDAVVCIGQPAHAWLSGQLARAWALDPVEPWEEVCLAAEQHDLGMTDWDTAPELNPETGRPYSFMEMPLDTHLRLWSAAPHRMLAQSRYAALLVSMHGTALYEMRDLDRLDESEAALVRGYLAQQRSVQERLRATLDGARVGPRVAVGPGVTLAPGSDVDESVLHAGVTVGEAAHIRRSILGPGSSVGARATVAGSVLGERSSVRAGGVLDGARLAPFAVA
jgi:NDP-sugar pyrophosphorylase family protein